MREDVKTFKLSGMGCSASVVAMDMARDLLASYPESLALLVGTENGTLNTDYAGNDKSFMLTNSIFRVGGNAVRAKMRLRYVVRTNTAADDEAYACVMNKEDDDGIYRICLRPSLLDVATRALRTNLASLGPQVLPLLELLYYAYVNMWCVKVLKRTNMEPYVPNFKLAFQHFCVHPDGSAVIDGIGKSLRLTDLDLEASRMALFRFGNTSGSGVWYEAAYIEAKRRIKRGDHLIQIALGSGFKCNTAVWEVLRETHPWERTAWDDCIHRYPCNTRKNFSDDYYDKLLNRLNLYRTNDLA